MTSHQTGAAGGAFAVCFAAALLLVRPPDGNEQDATFTAFYADAGHRTQFLAAGALIALAAMAWIVFATGLAARAGEGELARVAWGCAISATALLCAGGALLAAVPGLVAIDDAPVPSADVLRLLTFASFTELAMFAMPVLALGLALSAVGGMREELLPRAVGWSGVAVSVLLLASLAWFPMLLLAAWTLLVSGLLVRRPLRIPLPHQAERRAGVASRPDG